MEDLLRHFIEKARQEFQFLIDDFGFRKRRTEKGMSTSVSFTNKTTGVKVVFDWRDQYIQVDLYRLVSGEMRMDPMIVLPEGSGTRFSLDQVLAVRGVKAQLRSTQIGTPVKTGDIDSTLRRCARALREHAADIMRGDFSIVSALDRMSNERIHEYYTQAGRLPEYDARLAQARLRARQRGDSSP
jgi:hypothetical protein